MATAVRLVDFSPGDLDTVLDAMADLGRDRNGWINVRARPEDDDAEFLAEFAPKPVPSPLGIFGRRRPVAVEGTWIPGPIGRRGEEPASVGLEHPAGRFAVRQLRDAGTPLPAGWKVVVDHARRGLVVSVPPGADPVADQRLILTWLLDAARALAPDQVAKGRWQAEIHTR